MISFLNKTILQFEEIEIYLPSAGDLRLLRFWWHVDLTRISSDVYQWHMIYRVVLLFQWSCTLIDFSAWHVGRDVDFESNKFLLLWNIWSLNKWYIQTKWKRYKGLLGVSYRCWIGGGSTPDLQVIFFHKMCISYYIWQIERNELKDVICYKLHQVIWFWWWQFSKFSTGLGPLSAKYHVLPVHCNIINTWNYKQKMVKQCTFWQEMVLGKNCSWACTLRKTLGIKA